MSTLPTPPAHGFASDNNATVHPAVLEAIHAANVGHAKAYGDDPWTERCADQFRELFGGEAETFLVWNGTGGNVVALGSLLGPAQAVVCAEGSHINVDEAGATERIAGAKLIDVPTADGKLRPEQLEELRWLLDDVHHAQPTVLSITQSTELGTLYQPAEVGELCDAAHRLGLLVHIDGARIANAVAALGGTVEALCACTVDAGVDVITFGGTKNGMLGGEAVVYLRPGLTRFAGYARKQFTQLPSKMRFVAAQMSALLDGGLWLQNAAHANAMARRLHDAVAHLVTVAEPAVNSLYPVLERAHAEELRQWSFFYDWDVAAGTVRWMTSWDTTDDDVDTFAAGVRGVVGAAV